MKLFEKADVSREKVESFCAWFEENGPEFIRHMENSQNDRESVFRDLDAIEARLATVYRDGYRGRIEFEYGYDSQIGKYHLRLFHKNHKFLTEAAGLIAQELNRRAGENWFAEPGK